MFTKHLTCNKVPAKLQDINYDYYLTCFMHCIEQANKLLLRGNISTEKDQDAND